MASPSDCNEPLREELGEAEPNLKDIHNLLKNIQGAIDIIQGTITSLAKDNSKLTEEVAELRHEISKSNSAVTKLQKELKDQNTYVASLEIELNRVKNTVKEQKENIEELQVSFEELEQYSRKNSVEIHGIPEDIDAQTDEIVCKVAEAVGVEMTAEKIEISHRLYRKQGIKPIIVKFANHNDKTKLYKARTQLKNVTLSSIFPSSLSSGQRNHRIFINENLTNYRREMMSLALQKKKDGKIISFWSLDGKVFIKTAPSGRPRKMLSIEDVKQL